MYSYDSLSRLEDAASDTSRGYAYDFEEACQVYTFTYSTGGSIQNV